MRVRAARWVALGSGEKRSLPSAACRASGSVVSTSASLRSMASVSNVMSCAYARTAAVSCGPSQGTLANSRTRALSRIAR